MSERKRKLRALLFRVWFRSLHRFITNAGKCLMQLLNAKRGTVTLRKDDKARRAYENYIFHLKKYAPRTATSRESEMQLRKRRHTVSLQCSIEINIDLIREKTMGTNPT